MLKRNTLLALGTAELHVSAILPNHMRRLVRPNSQNLESQTVRSHRLSAVTDCLQSQTVCSHRLSVQPSPSERAGGIAPSRRRRDGTGRLCLCLRTVGLCPRRRRDGTGKRCLCPCTVGLCPRSL